MNKDNITYKISQNVKLANRIELEKEIVRLYTEGINLDMIAKKFDKCKATIHRILDKHQVIKYLKPRWQESEINIIKENYAKYGAIYCKKFINRSVECVVSMARKLGIKMINKGVANLVSLDKINIHPEQFYNPTSPEVIYILGLLWADGFVDIQGRIRLNCVLNDTLDFEPTFDKVGVWRKKIILHKKEGWQPTKQLSTSNRRLADFLISNDYKSKSFASADKILALIPDNLKYYWFRALFDGDGYLIMTDKNAVGMTITSSYNQDWAFMETLGKKLDISYNIYRDKYINKKGILNSRSIFKIGNRDGFCKFFQYIYQDRDTDNIGLKRKYNKWLEILEKIKYINVLKNKTGNKFLHYCDFTDLQCFINHCKSLGAESYVSQNIVH